MRSPAQRMALWVGMIAACMAMLVLPERTFGDDEQPPRSLFQRAFGGVLSAPKETEATLRKSVQKDVSALYGDNSKMTAAVALQRTLNRLESLPADNSPLDATQQVIANVYRSDPVRGQLVGYSMGLLTWDKHIGDQHKDQFPLAVRIFQALGVPDDVSSWQISAERAITLYADDGVDRQIEAAEEVARAVWAVGQRARDQWPGMSKEISAFTFVWAFQNHESFRPANWPTRLRSAVDTSQPDYVRIYGFNHTPVPLNLTASLDDSGSDNLAVLIEYGMNRDRISSGKVLSVQMAAVNLAGRSRSMYFAPAIRDVLANTDNPDLRRAAEVALKACTRPVAEINKSPETAALIDLDTQRIDEIFLGWLSTTSGTPQSAELRSLTGLDYGDERDAWLTWWKRDQQSRTMCRNGERNFLYRGRVVDDRGQPISQATVSVSVAGEFTYHLYGGPIHGWVDTDRDGRFLIRCGFGTIDRDRRGIVSAVMHVNRPGYHYLASTGPLKRYFTEFDLSDEPLIQIDPDETVYPRSPVEMTMILRPAAQVEVSVVDSAGQPVKPLNIGARWVELHPEEASPVGYCGCCDENWASGVFMPETVQRNQPRSVWLPAAAPGLPPEQVRPALAAYAKQRTEPVVSFYFSQFRPGVSRRFAIYTQPKASEPDAISNAVSLPTAGRYRVQLTWNPDAPPDQQLLAEVTSSP